MEVSAMAQGFYILIILLLLTLSEIQCKASKWYYLYIQNDQIYVMLK